MAESGGVRVRGTYGKYGEYGKYGKYVSRKYVSKYVSRKSYQYQSNIYIYILISNKLDNSSCERQTWDPQGQYQTARSSLAGA